MHCETDERARRPDRKDFVDDETDSPAKLDSVGSILPVLRHLLCQKPTPFATELEDVEWQVGDEHVGSMCGSFGDDF